MYHEIVYRLINYVESHSDNHITVEELESVANYSYRNLQRIFKFATGETIGAFQKRLKLEKAYKLLLFSKKTISEIAIESNFESLAAFSKSFKHQFLISPTEAKLKKISLLENNFLKVNSIEGYLKPEIIFIPSVEIFYQTTLCDYTSDDIEVLWKNFFHLAFPENNTVYYGVIADEPLITEKLKCRYSAGSSAQCLHSELPSQIILGKKYAKFLHGGSYHLINETYKNIYTNWIFEDSFEFDSSPIIEQYIKHSENTILESDYITAILIPLIT